MPDMIPSSPAVSERMAKVANRDTAAELAVRRELHRRGFRYRVNRPIPELGRTRPDVTFPRERVAVFIDGCFWHRCPDHATSPKVNAEWWAEKLERNVTRDLDITRILEGLGWRVLRIWEHVPVDEAANMVEKAVLERSTP